MTRAECVRELLNEYQSRRVQNEREQDARIEEAERLDPEIARLRGENRTLAASTLRRMMALTSDDERRECAEQMRQRGRFNNDEICRRLRAAGLPEDYLDMKYRCDVCQDTGYVGDAPSRFCDCFEAALSRMLHEDGSMARTDEHCFERFDERIFPEAGGQRAAMVRLRRFCEKYADEFPETKVQNLVFIGKTGLGKTFLLNCIYERVVGRGIPAIRVTAFRMFEAMRRYHMGRDGEEQSFDELLCAPLLLIDDLGSEPMMNNITLEYLFTLLNERVAARRHTVIATNLFPAEIQQRYGERLMSRLLDKRLCAVLEFSGADVRVNRP